MAIFRFAPLMLALLWQQVGVVSVQGVTLEELKADPKMTPATLLAYFSDFTFHLRGNTQNPTDFLSTKAGDCDDFANVAAQVLRARGYTPRVVVVSLEKVTHVVCYVSETRSYLDYNRRRDRTLVPSDGTLRDIARSVASSFQSKWYSVSEVAFVAGARRFLSTEFQ